MLPFKKKSFLLSSERDYNPAIPKEHKSPKKTCAKLLTATLLIITQKRKMFNSILGIAEHKIGNPGDISIVNI